MKRNNSKYTHGRTCVYNINYHIIWGTKYRNKWMTTALEDEIKQILHNIASENGFAIEHIEIGLDDHIHLLVSAPPKLSVTVIVKCLKGTSSKGVSIVIGIECDNWMLSIVASKKDRVALDDLETLLSYKNH